MKNRIIRYLDFVSQTRLLVISGVSMVLLILVFSFLPNIGGKLIDLLPSYTYETIMPLMDSYGENGRRLYSFLSPTLDTLFPIVYVSFYAGLIHRLKPRPWYLALVPLCLGIIDLCENTQIVMMLVQFPDVSPKLVTSASFFTFIKHRFTNLTFFIVIVLIILRLIQRLRKRVIT